MKAGDDLRLDYDPRPGAHDEMLASRGAPRRHWAPLVRSIETLGRSELARRWESARRIIQENGVTYNVYGDPLGLDRPWELDPFPLVIAPDDWAALRAGLQQRGRVLAALLADLYGPQRLLRQNRLPPELVFANPAYLRPCRGLLPGSADWLQLYAADLARSPDGHWWVLADRTQAPSGVGYALENRTIISRTLPEAFRHSRVERLAGFFQRVLDGLRERVPRQRENPRIALLTPGPWNETYFEHAYLARYLGLTLVEGADLTMRDCALFLKTLGGLERIDVLVRRVDDVFCDPLSLRGDSSLGVAGLLQAVRAGNVAVANALGSGLVETPALLAFLPGLCRALLGEELLLPSVATWWCGQENALDYVLEHLDTLVIKPSFPGTRMEPVFGGQLAREPREALVRELRARPHAYVAQERVALATAPVWDGERAHPHHVSLRAYAVACNEGDWEVMPGGLTRVSPERDSVVVSMQRGGGSKDTWVCSDGSPAWVSLLRPAGAPVELRRAGAELPSRVADDLFWLGRYLERLEGMSRVARTLVSRLADERSGTGVEIAPLRAALAFQGGLAPAAGAGGLESSLLSFLFDGAGPSSFRAALRSIHQLAFSLRDQLSLDTWRVLAELQREIESGAPKGGLEAARGALNRAIGWLSAWSGLVTESMTRTLGWRFAEFGRRIERASYTGTLLQNCLVPELPDEAPVLEALLETAESVITYRRRYLSDLQALPVLDLLLTDETNPRSVAFQLATLNEHLKALPGAASQVHLREEERLALAALSRVRLVEVAELGRVEAGKRLRLEKLLVSTAQDLGAFSDALTQSYLSHAGEARRIGSF